MRRGMSVVRRMAIQIISNHLNYEVNLRLPRHMRKRMGLK